MGVFYSGDGKRSASVYKNDKGLYNIYYFYDDGWEVMRDHILEDIDSMESVMYHVESYFKSAGGVSEDDPNEALKAAGFVWNGYMYAKPQKGV